MYRKSPNTDIYLDWQSFARNTWKRGTLKVLISRASNICSTNYHLPNELKHLENFFQYSSSYLHRLIKQILEQLCKAQKRDLDSKVSACSSDSNISETTAAKFAHAALPYKGTIGEKVLNFLKSSLKRFLRKEIETRIVYTSTKLRSQFGITVKTKFEHQHDLVYHAKCPDCDDNHKKKQEEDCNNAFVTIVVKC